MPTIELTLSESELDRLQRAIPLVEASMGCSDLGVTLEARHIARRAFLLGLARIENPEKDASEKPRENATPKKTAPGARRHCGPVQYGWRPAAGGGVEPDPAAQAVIDRIVALRDGGMSFVDVAAALTAENVPTVRGQSVWNSTTPRRLYATRKPLISLRRAA